jgi:hypothetical protein
MAGLELKDDAVMAGLVPAIHVLERRYKVGVDIRHKAGHDERRLKALARIQTPDQISNSVVGW